MEIHLVLEHGPSEGPDSGEDEVELVEILMAVWRSVFWDEETLQEVAQHLHQTLFRNRDDLLKSGSRTESSSVISNFNTSLPLSALLALERNSVSNTRGKKEQIKKTDDFSD